MHTVGFFRSCTTLLGHDTYLLAPASANIGHNTYAPGGHQTTEPAHLACGRVQGRKQLVLCQHTSSSQRVEQRRLACRASATTTAAATISSSKHQQQHNAGSKLWTQKPEHS
jgi:hypothetical protein